MAPVTVKTRAREALDCAAATVPGLGSALRRHAHLEASPTWRARIAPEALRASSADELSPVR